MKGFICCINMPDCPPGLLPETPFNPTKIYDENLEIGCISSESISTWNPTVKEILSETSHEKIVDVELRE